MAEYIKKEDIEHKIQDGLNNLVLGHDAIEVLGMIYEMPSADVAPVRHGRWIFGKDLPYSWGQIPKNKYHLYCSECSEQAFNRSEDNAPDFDVDTSCCPNCGCRMDG